MANKENEWRRILESSPKGARDLLAELMMASILEGDFPEESKIEVRLIKVIHEIEGTLHSVRCDFACPLPSHEPEGKDVQLKAFPARKALLEYLHLMKGGLDAFLQQVPAPEIPQKYKEQVERHDQY